MDDLEDLSPRKIRREITIAKRQFVAIVSEQSIGEQVICEALHVEAARQLQNQPPDWTDLQILQAWTEKRNLILPRLLHFEVFEGTALTESDWKALEFSVAQRVFDDQERCNRKSDILGEAQRQFVSPTGPAETPGNQTS